MNSLAKLLEAALFASPRPIPTDELAALDPESSPAAVQAALDELREHYDVDGHGVELLDVGGGWQVLTRPEYTEAIERAQMAVRPARLSAAALETLAIIAYRQPIGRAEVAEIRGVDVGAVIRSLHERGLIDVVGRAEGLGRPLLYGTTAQFLEQFALRHLEELPRVDELAIALRRSGDAAEPADVAPADAASTAAASTAAASTAAAPTDAAAPDAAPTDAAPDETPAAVGAADQDEAAPST
ncbi:MAG TPA: SMC-Scp complex subunit ScpB [Gemmatimonadaceae bacterium]|nr:SMC-Scp complex subunit ScpB [Gemmatimonadaceae bacterium]